MRFDNFLWSMERHFVAARVGDDAPKLRALSMFLDNVAMLWWQRQSDAARRGADVIATLEGFKAELKA